MGSKLSKNTAGCVRGVAAAAVLLTSAHLALADDEMTSILGACAGQYCSPATNAGNAMILTQQGQSNTASVEQQAILGAYANSANLSQSGNSNFLGLSQTGGGNAAGITQSGNNNSLSLSQPGGASASVSQTGNNLGLNITQGPNSSIGVTQYGNGTAGAAPYTINTFK